MLIRLGSKLTLAAISGALIPLTYGLWDSVTWTNEFLDWFLFYGLPGAMFAAGVFWPYLKLDRYKWLRFAGIAAASVLSYWCAIEVATETGHGWGSKLGSLQGFVVASIVGTSIVLVTAIPIAPIRWTRLYWILGLVGSIISGVLFGNLYDDELVVDMLAYAQWHTIVAVTLHYGVRHS